MTKTPLLFLTTVASCDQRTAVTSTAAWIAREAGVEFDAYIPITLFGRPGQSPITPPALGQWHQPQFYHLANCFEMTFCSVADTPVVPFRRDAATFGARMLPHRPPTELAAFYRDLLETYGQAFPTELVVIPAPSDNVDGLNLEPYCYPEIYYRQALGVTAAAADAVVLALHAAGARKAKVVYCPDDVTGRLERLGFEVEVIDRLLPDDTMGSVTTRITERWSAHGNGIAYGGHSVMVKMLPFSMRHDHLPLVQFGEWPLLEAFGKTVGEYARRFGNPLIWGSQGGGAGGGDNVITEYSKHDIAMSLGIGVSGPTVQERLTPAAEWLPAAPAPWEDEYAEDFLEQKAREGAVPVCYLHYAGDFGHVTSCVRLFDVMASWYGRCGLAFPSTWYDFYGPLLELLYQPAAQGGVFPRVEPLVATGGIGVITEANGFASRDALVRMLKQSLADIKRHVGENKAPLGYLPWQDADPYYQTGSAEPRYDVPLEAGFDYAFTTKDEAKPPAIVFQDGDYVVLNRQERHWRLRQSLTHETQLWEKELVGSDRGAWIMIDMDAPFWFQVPVYYDPDQPAHYHREGFDSSSMEFARALKYADRGGDSGKLFLVKPHELVRYVRMLQRLGRLPRR